ncbi:uncharacterized protein PGTG_14824 [Puccinia graminis f. sp. tritici CRL 75-36-700-3]|uniref:ASTRA-associated protein 1 n=1 Tax=Puccinia graminis f. sp. tritici (strain CRL 75-36-700-3 / race SCCL) TaxID=418459 RepID=E3KWE4_PUCGT|nr:uncharacterized protein PGTG_14824 [Puccinia graminis f. sp. tritici CRL 75-36-700-3]EFP88619.2 hypothetical protein PGTG_14824 [Puccinia graminis f. sp. tritici CRL 75-36-700-3]
MLTRPAPEPVYLFRPTHQELSTTNNRAINHLNFISLKQHQHLALLTADNHGWISIWNLDSKRTQSLWHPHPHTQSIGGCLSAWPLTTHSDQSSSLFILSQGRDHQLILNQILNYTKTCSISTITRANLKPTHSNPSTNVSIVAQTPINAINFCKASSLPLHHSPLAVSQNIHSIVALPSLISEEFVDIFAIRIVDPPKIIKICEALGREKDQGRNKTQTGSVVAVQLYSPPGTKGLILMMIGYESGEARILKNESLIDPGFQSSSSSKEEEERMMDGVDWEEVGRFQGHTEPILSLTISIDPLDRLAGIGWSVGADRKIVRYELTAIASDPPAHCPHTNISQNGGQYQMSMNPMVFETNQPGRFDVQVRSDGKVLGIYTWGGKLWLFDTTAIEPDQAEPPKITGSRRDKACAVESARPFTLRPLLVLKLPTEPEHRSGVLAFAPFPPPPPPLLAPSSPPASPPRTLPNRLDSLAGLALLVASAPAGQIIAWEVFPPPPLPQSRAYMSRSKQSEATIDPSKENADSI